MRALKGRLHKLESAIAPPGCHLLSHRPVLTNELLNRFFPQLDHMSVASQTHSLAGGAVVELVDAIGNRAERAVRAEKKGNLYCPRCLRSGGSQALRRSRSSSGACRCTSSSPRCCLALCVAEICRKRRCPFRRFARLPTSRLSSTNSSSNHLPHQYRGNCAPMMTNSPGWMFQMEYVSSDR